MSEERYCSNCRSEIPKGAVVCPLCGVYAGDVFDGKKPKSPRAYATWIAIPVVLALIALVWAWPRPDRKTGSRQRMQALIKDRRHQVDVMQAIRRRLVADGLPESCLALVGKGNREARRYLAIDICHDRPMGEWTADPNTGHVTRLK